MLGLRRLVIVACLAGTAFAASPAFAVGVGGGMIEGLVNVPGGIPAGACGPTSYTFADTSFVGAFVDSVAGANAGKINVSANGGSACENTQGGSGVVNANCTTADGVATNPPPPHLQFGMQCALSGGYLRIGPVLISMSPATASLVGTCQNVVCAVEVPATILIPLNGNGVTSEISSFEFAGMFLEQS